jgi:hypothetical protein
MSVIWHGMCWYEGAAPPWHAACRFPHLVNDWRGAILVYSLAPILWILIASITPELEPNSTGVWQSARAVDEQSAQFVSGDA